MPQIGLLKAAGLLKGARPAVFPVRIHSPMMGQKIDQARIFDIQEKLIGGGIVPGKN